MHTCLLAQLCEIVLVYVSANKANTKAAVHLAAKTMFGEVVVLLSFQFFVTLSVSALLAK